MPDQPATPVTPPPDQRLRDLTLEIRVLLALRIGAAYHGHAGTVRLLGRKLAAAQAELARLRAGQAP